MYQGRSRTFKILFGPHDGRQLFLEDQVVLLKSAGLLECEVDGWLPCYSDEAPGDDAWVLAKDTLMLQLALVMLEAWGIF